jgi:hypothetical protein
LRRILLVLSAAALMAAMLVVMQAPAMAQGFDFGDDDFDRGDFFFDRDFDDDDFFGNGFGGSANFDQEAGDTGDIDLSTRVSQSGDNSNQCVAPLQFGNTGNFQNQQGFSQFGSFADDVEFDGGSFEFNPEQAVECNQAVQQSAAASSWWGW